jgi:hypothetical protein
LSKPEFARPIRGDPLLKSVVSEPPYALLLGKIRFISTVTLLRGDRVFGSPATLVAAPADIPAASRALARKIVEIGKSADSSSFPSTPRHTVAPARNKAGKS